MTAPLAVFDDVRAATANLLRAELAGRGEPYVAGAKVGAKLPRNIETSLPFVLVAVDSNTITYPILARVTVRGTVWHADEDQAFDLAQLCHALIVVKSPHGAIPGLGPVCDVDPDNELDFATFTCRVNARSTVVPA